MTAPTIPIERTGTGEHLPGHGIELPDDFLERLALVCPTVTDLDVVAEASRDWWPLALHWSIAGEVPRRAAVIARPVDAGQVPDVLALCDEFRVPVTPAGGRSGVCGASVPVFGGVLLDLTALDRVVDVDAVSGVVRVEAGAFGPDLERALEPHGLTVGHFPQSFELATVGGWVACRGAGQFSTRYGKIEDMVVGLTVVLADGRVVRTGGAPAAAVGPDLNQLFVGSEGTLGVITEISLRAHPAPPEQRRAAYHFPSLSAGFEACRSIVRRGATPAVLRLYDGPESSRGRGGDGDTCTLLVLDQGDAVLVDAVMSIVHDVCSGVAASGEVRLVDDWMQHRNDTSALQGLTRKGFVVDTMEIAARWADLDAVYEAATAALLAIPHARAATCHLSHSYLDGACLYFTFAATPPPEMLEATYVAMWDAGQRAVLAAGANLSHHHGIGLNRARFVADALGPAFDVLVATKHALDPNGILNPGKLGLPGPFGAPAWP